MNKSKFKSKPTKDRDKIIISREEYESYENQYICDICRGALEYKKIDGDESFWCNNCVLYVQVKNAKKTVPFEVPQDVNVIEPAITSIDGIDSSRVKIEHRLEPAGVFKSMQERGFKIKNYTETDGAGRPITKRRKYDDDG